jgi:choline dehydrogenase
MSTPTYDYIICGAGTAGCLMANRLSFDKTKRVLLIEAGGQDDYLWIHIPVGYLHCIGNPRTDWLYRTEAEQNLNGRALRYPRGKVLGGSSSINGMIYMRGQARDYDHWAALGNEGWGWEQCLPAFMAHEDFHGGADAFHAAPGHDPLGARAGGEWRVERQRLRWDILDAFAQAAVQAGIPALADFNRGDNEGVGYFEVNQRSGIRWNASKGFLRPALDRDNLQVWTGAEIDQLLLTPATDTPWRAQGVRVQPRAGGEAIEAHATREVILCAGAIGSPVVLQRSGIGDAESLHAHGVVPRHALPGVGRNLQDHLQMRSVFQVRGVRTLNTMSQSWWSKAMMGLDYLLRRRGPMSMAPSQLGAFTRSSSDQPCANLQYHVQPLSLDAFGEPLHRFNAFTASVCHLNPTSRGEVHIRSPRLEDAPRIAPNYLSTPDDREIAAQALRVTRRIVAQDALAPYQPTELKPGAHLQNDDELVRAAGDIGTTIFHPVGTTKMGPASDPSAVVDACLRVHGVQGLRVVDAGIMPTITSGNTNSPTLMIAERAAAWVLADAKD